MKTRGGLVLALFLAMTGLSGCQIPGGSSSAQAQLVIYSVTFNNVQSLGVSGATQVIGGLTGAGLTIYNLPAPPPAYAGFGTSFLTSPVWSNGFYDGVMVSPDTTSSPPLVLYHVSAPSWATFTTTVTGDIGGNPVQINITANW